MNALRMLSVQLKTVTYPFVHWQNSTGTLAFYRDIFVGALAEKIKQAFAEQTLFLPGYESATVKDAVLGRL